MVKYICEDCPEPCEITVADGSDVPSCCPFRLVWKAVNWHEAAENLQDKPLPKLTAEVFDRPDCPEWAKWAAVTPHGSLLFFAEKPIIVKNENNFENWNTDKKWYYGGMGYFDISNWQNSLIERPAQLPEWCKVGEWVYRWDEIHGGEYCKIIKIQTEGMSSPLVHFDNGEKATYGSLSWDDVTPAHLRPYNADEMKALMGKVIEKGPSMHIVTGFENVFDNECMVHVNGCLYGAKDLLRQFTIDNAPCGVLEHLENGGWVE